MLFDILRAALAATFLLSGTMKLRDRSAFQMALSSLGIEARSLKTVLGAVLPPAELALGLLLVWGYQTSLALAGALFLLALFTLVLTVQLLRGRVFSCQCFGLLSGSITTWWDVARNLALIGCAVFLLAMGGAQVVGYISLGGMLLGTAALAVLLVVLQLGQRISTYF